MAVREWERRLCDCPKGGLQRPLYDARGIFCCYVCDGCEAEKRRKYRPDIFTDSNYWADEPIEENE